MKQQVSPVVMGVIIAVVVIVVILIGMKSLSPPAPSAPPKPAANANRPTEINGHPVPPNAPVDYMNKKPMTGGGNNGMPHP